METVLLSADETLLALVLFSGLDGLSSVFVLSSKSEARTTKTSSLLDDSLVSYYEFYKNK